MMVRSFTVKDVLNQKDLGLRLVTPAVDEALGRLVLGAHGTEVRHPVPWLQRDWILMITGVRLIDNPERQRELVRELSEGGLAALGFGVGIDFDTVPEELIDEARGHHFPVFEIPLRTPFRRIVEFVNKSLLSADLYTMRRLTSMREFLLDSFREEDPQAVIVQRLASLLDCTAILFSGEGAIEAQAGPVNSQELWARIQESPTDEVRDIALGDRTALVQPVIDRGLPRSWLAVVQSRPLSADAYARPLTDTAALLLSGLSSLRRASLAVQRATTATFVTDLLEQPGGGENGVEIDSVAAHRAAAVGLDMNERVRGIAIVPPGGPDQDGENGLTQAERVFRAAALRVVLAAREGRAMGFVQYPDEAALDKACEFLNDRLPGAQVGLGRRVASASQLRDTLLDAECVLRQPRARIDREVGIHRFEDFDLATWLISLADRDLLRDKATATLDGVLEDEVLMTTLDAFLDQRLNVIRTAKRLDLHPNSLRYRIGRIEELLGCSLKDPDAIAAVQLARRILSP